MKFLIGTYTSLGGPGVCVAEAVSGHLSLISANGSVDNPNYLILSRDGKTVYTTASMRGGKGAVAAFRFENGECVPLSIQPCGGDETCHLTLDEDEEFLYAANYNSGSVSVFPVRDGYIFPRAQLIRHKDFSGVVPDRQEAPHTHFCAFRPGTAEVFVCDLGADQVVVYTQESETGLLVKTGVIEAFPGTGPRHLSFDGPDRFYLVGELSSAVTRYEFEEGVWRAKETLSTLPENAPANTAAAIRCLGNDLYITNRGHNSVSVFRTNAAGAFTREGIFPLRGRCPRDILPLPDGSFLTANQKSGTVEWSSPGEFIASLDVPGAVCLLSLEAAI